MRGLLKCLFTCILYKKYADSYRFCAAEIHPKKTADKQEFDLGEHTTQWLKLSRLDPFQHDMSQNFAALTRIELWGND